MIPNYELLCEAVAIVDGVPDDRFNLNYVLRVDGSIWSYRDYSKTTPHTCGTVTCALGTLALHPKFKALGFSFSPLGYLQWKGSSMGYVEAAQRLFGATWRDSENLFGPAGESTYDRSKYMHDHKKLFRHRVVQFLERKGQPVSEQFKSSI